MIKEKHKHIWIKIENDTYSSSYCYNCNYLRMKMKAENCLEYPTCKITTTMYQYKPYEKCSICSKNRVKINGRWSYPIHLSNIQWYEIVEEVK